MEVFYEEAFLKIFTKFTDSAHVFSYEFCEIFKNTFFHWTRLLPVSVITLVPFPIYQFIFLLPLFFFYQVTELQNYRSPYETIAIILPLQNHCNNPSWKDYEHNNFCKKKFLNIEMFLGAVFLSDLKFLILFQDRYFPKE